MPLLAIPAGYVLLVELCSRLIPPSEGLDGEVVLKTIEVKR
jgi:hypothetical protein